MALLAINSRIGIISPFFKEPEADEAGEEGEAAAKEEEEEEENDDDDDDCGNGRIFLGLMSRVTLVSGCGASGIDENDWPEPMPTPIVIRASSRWSKDSSDDEEEEGENRSSS